MCAIKIICYYTETPEPPLGVNISVTDNSIVLSINDNIKNNQWELWHYRITVYDKDRNNLGLHKMIDTPIRISKDKVERVEVVTVTLCNQTSSPMMMDVPQNLIDTVTVGGAAGTSQTDYLILLVLVVALLLN